MNTVEDIDYLTDPAKDYRLPWVAKLFRSEKDVNFPGSPREWAGILELLNERLKNEYRITGISAVPPYELPFVYHFRDAYADVLSKRPDTIAECNAVIEDMAATLQSIRGLNDITPFSNAKPNSALLKRTKGVLPIMEHVKKGTPSMLELEARTVTKWNDRRKTNGRKPDKTPWAESVFRQVIESDDTTGCRMFPDGETKTLSHFLLRETPKDERSFDLIDFAANEEPGVSDMMTEALMQVMKKNCRMRLKNLVEQSH